MTLLKQTAIALLCVAASTSAFSAPFSQWVTNDNHTIAKGGVANGIPTPRHTNDGSPDLYQAVNQIIGTSYVRNSDLDNRFEANDSFFKGTGTHEVALIGLTASNKNILGVYTDLGAGTGKTPLLSAGNYFGIPHQGTAADPYQGGVFTTTGVFGWYLESRDFKNNSLLRTFYSEANLNAGGWDHMVTYAIPELNGSTRYIDTGSGSKAYTFTNAFLIGWEDLPWNYNTKDCNQCLGDDDYDDMIYLVDFRPTVDVSEPVGLGLFGTAAAALIALRRRQLAKK